MLTCNALQAEAGAALRQAQRRTEVPRKARGTDGMSRELGEGDDAKRPEHHQREYDRKEDEKDELCRARGAPRDAGKSQRPRDEGDHNEHNQEFDHRLSLLAKQCETRTRWQRRRHSAQSRKSAGTLPPFAASLAITCLCNQTFIVAESLVSPV